MTSPTSAGFDKPTRQTFFVADLKCYLCGGIAGSIESEQTLEPGVHGVRPVLLRKSGESHVAQVADWRRLRCVRCSGPLYLDESDVVVRRTDAYNWLEERPRRGRPPKRLLEERRRERELSESQAA
jgi:hypothetical protein